MVSGTGAGSGRKGRYWGLGEGKKVGAQNWEPVWG